VTELPATGHPRTGYEDLWRAGWTMAAVLGSLFTAMLLRSVTGLTAQAPVLAATLALTLSRVPLAGGWNRLEAVVEVPLVALAAAGSGELIVHRPVLGQPLLVVGLSIGILARRYGPAARRAGRLIALPFLALLITPVAPVPGSAAAVIAWSPVLALVALAWRVGVGSVAERVAPGSAPVGALADPASEPAPAGPRARSRRLDAPTRMALQMATGLGAALAVGHLLFGDRWGWTLLSAFLVASGNRGRGDVVHKAGLRLLGAALGTVGASAIATAVPAGHLFVLVLLFAVMAVSLVLRGRSYAWWAAGVTAMVALLHGYYGESGAGLLAERLLGVLVGSAIGVAAAWFVAPVRTRDVFRRRVADCLAALTDGLADEGEVESAAGRYRTAVARLDELTPTLRTHQRFLGRFVTDPEPHAMDAVLALRTLDPLPVDRRHRLRLRRDVVRVRRAMVGKDDPTADQLVPPLGQVHEVLQGPMRR
jgi:hypothetical protein